MHIRSQPLLIKQQPSPSLNPIRLMAPLLLQRLASRPVPQTAAAGGDAGITHTEMALRIAWMAAALST